MKVAAMSAPPMPKSPPGWGFHGADLVRDDLPHDGRIPIGPIEGPGEHDFGHVPPEAGELDQ
jgi:hypothetical protein